MDKKIKVILIHGNGNSTKDDHWIPVVAEELRSCGLTVIAPQFPETELAYQRVWLPFLKNDLKADENTILIGHSSGAIAAMKYAEENQILGSVLVGVYHTHLEMDSEKNSGYFDTPWKWDTIKKNQNWIIEFASIDDPWIPIEEARFIQQQLQPEYYEYTDQGHFDNEHHKLGFPDLVEAVKRKLFKEVTF